MSLADSIHVSVMPDKPSTTQRSPLLIFLTTGNPGLAEYYREFIDSLRDSLKTSDPNVRAEIVCHSLGGFELQAEPDRRTPLSLQDQVTFAQDRLESAVRQIQRDSSRSCAKDGPFPVVLIGHSVGAYILLEIIARRQQAQKQDAASDSDYKLIGGIGLFPTVVDISRSSNGRKAVVSSRLVGRSNTKSLTDDVASTSP